MFDNLADKKMLLILPVAAGLLLTGCKEEETSAVPEPEPVDLAQTQDLFTEPVKPNPLTSDPEAVVVRVNGEDITRGEIQELMNAAMAQLAGRVAPQQMQQLQGQMYAQVKNDLIVKKLLDAEVAKADIQVDDAKVTEAIEQIKGEIPEGQSFEALLAAQGVTEAELTENLRKDMATRKFLESKADGIADATEEEAKEFYDGNPDRFKKPESVTASHILIKFDEGDTDEAKAEKKAQLEKIRADIVAGTITFADAASGNSDCPSKAQDGSLGTFGKGQMVPEFEVAAFTQEIDEVGDIVETQFGYHIITVSDRQEEGVVTYDEAKEQILGFLSGQKKQQAVQDYVKSLRDAATIEEIAM
jgi:peptidyl-prolyl cis-trans isomerase C